jgi:hypothetical protein
MRVEDLLAGCCPQPRTTLPLGKTCVLPSKLVGMLGEWSYSLTSVAVMWVVSIRSRIPRALRSVGGPPPSSNRVIVPSGCITASCCPQVDVPRPILKLDRLPPSVQMTEPVR